MGTGLDSRGTTEFPTLLPDHAHRTRQWNAMQEADKAYGEQRQDTEKAIELLARWLQAGKVPSAWIPVTLKQETEELILKYHNNARNGQGVTK